MIDVFLRAGEANPNDVRLRDPTTADAASSHQIEPVAIASGEAFGQVGLNGTIAAVGIASTEAVGAVGLNSTIAPAGVASAAQVGSPTVQAQIELVGIATAEAFGTVGVRGTLVPVGIASLEALGTPGLHGTIAPAGIASASVVGQPVLDIPHTITAVGIASGAAVGHPTFEAGVVAPADTSGAGVSPPRRKRLELVARPPALLLPHGIASAVRVGVPTIDTSDAPRRLARLNSDALMVLAA